MQHHQTKVEEVITNRKDNKITTYKFFHCGTNIRHGVGLLIREDFKPIFNYVSDKICRAKFSLGGRHFNVTSVYAPTLAVSESHPNIRDDFYSILEKTICDVPKHNICIVLGDFNAKTGTGHSIFPENVGIFGKGILNSNGTYLLEVLSRQNMVITNTLFDHKMAHRTTWIAPFRKFTAHDGQPRKNPVRNQIDYIITRTNYRNLIQDSRSYAGMKTNTDHKLVKMTIKLKYHKLPKTNSQNKGSPKLNIKNIYDPVKQHHYRENLKVKHQESNREGLTPQERWKNVTDLIKAAGEEELGLKEKNQKYVDTELSELSEKQHKIKEDIESCTDNNRRLELRENTRTLRKKIDKIVQKMEERELDEKLKNIESMKDDSNKSHQAVRELKRLKPAKPIYVNDTNSHTATDTERQVELVQDHFNKMLAPANNINTIKSFQPAKMENPFTKEEIKKAAMSMKNGKSAGIDDIHAEYLKYAPESIHDEIAQIHNDAAETENYSSEIRTGILRPLPKPGKPQGPPSNLRPIILLSVLRKILAICLIRRCWDRLSTEIPREQAAYQHGRSTTEQVFSVKVLAEKAITSSDFSVYLLVLDMSKAFDTVNRASLLSDLQNILQDDELHLFHLLIIDVNIYVKIKDCISTNPIHTNIGICQGDCLSAVLFIYYLSKSLSVNNNKSDHNYTIPSEEQTRPEILEEHNYAMYVEKEVGIAPKYADDITWATTSKSKIDQVKRTVPPKLLKRNLIINDDKTEEFTISKSDQEWKNCKLLGSKLDTQKDIERRKGLTINVMKDLKPLFKNHRLKLEMKIRIFQSYVNPIFLYNSELWTMNAKDIKSIDAFHRRQLRYALNIIWPRKISNEDLYSITKVEQWSEVVMRRKLSWLGHLMRLPSDTPAQIALNEAMKPAKRPRGKPRTTWISSIKKDMIRLKIVSESDICDSTAFMEHLSELTEDRTSWNRQIRRAISEIRRTL